MISNYMKDMAAPSVSVTLNLSTSVCDSSGISSSTLQLVTDASSFLSVSSSNVISSDTNCIINSDSVIVTLNGDAMGDDNVLSVGEGTNLAIAEELLLNLPKKDQIAIILSDSITIPPQNLVLTSKDKGGSIVASQIPKEKPLRSVFEIDCVPLWGSVSLCGKRPEMEDAVAAKPRFLRIPIKMLIGDHAVGGLSQSLTHVTSHFYGVYDGHGGAQVANYCRDRLHFALAEQILDAKADLVDDPIGRRRQMQWQRTFTNCFQRVDDEIGGKVSRGITKDGDSSFASSEPLAPETVGSTAVVALVCSSHIIVANCGDSRAVLLRGKESMALSIDHKPDSESEYSRIEAAGGKVIQWNGYRVFGVLAMSRSIGDRYLKPWIIPEPEVMFIPRAKDDQCLVIASDGLWDVMTNEEVCEVARKRILVWHRKNGSSPSLMADRGEGVDPASQSAAEFLAKLAMEKGSKDNISVIVVDLKTQRKFKTKS